MASLAIVPLSSAPSALLQFENYLRLEKRASDNTISNYMLDLQHFEKWLAIRGKPLESAQREDVQDYISSRMADGLSGRSAQRKLATLRAFYGLLLDDEIITFRPTRGVPLPKIARTLPKTLTVDDIDRMVLWMEKVKDRHGRKFLLRDKAIMLTLFASGLRETELINLKLPDLDLENGFIRVWNGKGGKDGIVPLSPPAIEALTAYLQTDRAKLDPEQESPYVFLSYHHRGPLSRQGLFYRLREIGRQALGRDVSPHQFRHACATALLKGGADIRDVQAVLRHAGLDSTEIYLHTDITYLKGIYDQSHPRA